jgi:hypothetical protein
MRPFKKLVLMTDNARFNVAVFQDDCSGYVAEYYGVQCGGDGSPPPASEREFGYRSLKGHDANAVLSSVRREIEKANGRITATNEML